MSVCWICGYCLVGMNFSGSRGRGLDPVNVFKPPPPTVISYWPFQCGTSIVVPQYYMLCLYVYICVCICRTHLDYVSDTRTTTITYILSELFPIDVSDVISCPLHNINALWYIIIILYSNDKQVLTMCSVQDWQLSRLLCLEVYNSFPSRLPSVGDLPSPLMAILYNVLCKCLRKLQIKTITKTHACLFYSAP